MFFWGVYYLLGARLRPRLTKIPQQLGKRMEIRSSIALWPLPTDKNVAKERSCYFQIRIIQ
jgi:hypothetical protein